MRAGPPLLVVDGLTVAYGAVVAVRDVSLEVDAGGIVAGPGPERGGEDDPAPRDRRRPEAQSGSVTFDGRRSTD